MTKITKRIEIQTHGDPSVMHGLSVVIRLANEVQIEQKQWA